MGLFDAVLPSTALGWVTIPVAIIVLFYVGRYVIDPLGVRDIPGPWLAKITPYWLTSQARRTLRYVKVDEAHHKYGKFVRIAPNHISINDPEAIFTVYGHGNGFLKSDFYDAFVSIHRGLFNTRDRVQHARKRKVLLFDFSISLC